MKIQCRVKISEFSLWRQKILVAGHCSLQMLMEHSSRHKLLFTYLLIFSLTLCLALYLIQTHPETEKQNVILKMQNAK